MARKRSHGRGGRPSKGDRELFASRIPVSTATELRDFADELDLSYSEVIAELARIGLTHREEFRRHGGSEQEELPLKAS